MLRTVMYTKESELIKNNVPLAEFTEEDFKVSELGRGTQARN